LGHPYKLQRVLRLGSVTARHLVVGVSHTLRRWTEAPPMFGRATIKLGIGPHSSFYWVTDKNKLAPFCGSRCIFNKVLTCYVLICCCIHGTAQLPDPKIIELLLESVCTKCWIFAGTYGQNMLCKELLKFHVWWLATKYAKYWTWSKVIDKECEIQQICK